MVFLNLFSLRVHSGNVYTVKQGDYCAAIAAANGVSLDALEAANPSKNCNSISPGQQLCIPPQCSGNYYTVAQGDYCGTIASAGGVSLTALIAANPGINAACSNLQVGELLCIPSSCSGSTYTVAAGDSCSAIAATNSITLDALTAANPSVNCGNLQIGQKLCIPSSCSGSTYTVAAGDTCSAIATANSITLEVLTAANPSVNCGNLQIGQKLCIPSAPTPPIPAGSIAGFWRWTWSPSGSPAGTNLGEVYALYYYRYTMHAPDILAPQE